MLKTKTKRKRKRKNRTQKTIIDREEENNFILYKICYSQKEQNIEKHKKGE